MWRIALQTLRARGGSLAGAFAAVLLAVTFASASGLLMSGALEAPGGGRYAAADAVVRADPAVPLVTGEDAETIDVIPAPRLGAAVVDRVAAVPGVRSAVGDVSFPVGLTGRAARNVHGHGWSGAALTPYRLVRGRAPGSPAEVVADARLGLEV